MCGPCLLFFLLPAIFAVEIVPLIVKENTLADAMVQKMKPTDMFVAASTLTPKTLAILKDFEMSTTVQSSNTLMGYWWLKEKDNSALFENHNYIVMDGSKFHQIYSLPEFLLDAVFGISSAAPNKEKLFLLEPPTFQWEDTCGQGTDCASSAEVAKHVHHIAQTCGVGVIPAGPVFDALSKSLDLQNLEFLYDFSVAASIYGTLNPGRKLPVAVGLWEEGNMLLASSIVSATIESEARRYRQEVFYKGNTHFVPGPKNNLNFIAYGSGSEERITTELEHGIEAAGMTETHVLFDKNERLKLGENHSLVDFIFKRTPYFEGTGFRDHWNTYEGIWKPSKGDLPHVRAILEVDKSYSEKLKRYVVEVDAEDSCLEKFPSSGMCMRKGNWFLDYLAKRAKYYKTTKGVYVPLRSMWLRTLKLEKDIEIVVDEEGHMSEAFSSGLASMMFTIMTSGRNMIGPEPSKDTEPREWKIWRMRKMGYEIVYQYATLTARAPGFTVVPLSKARITKDGAAQFEVFFHFRPESDVTVAVLPQRTMNSEIVVSKTWLVFTPSNYNIPQLVTIALNSSVGSSNFRVSFQTHSDDRAFGMLADSWEIQADPATKVEVEHEVEKAANEAVENLKAEAAKKEELFKKQWSELRVDLLEVNEDETVAGDGGGGSMVRLKYKRKARVLSRKLQKIASSEGY